MIRKLLLAGIFLMSAGLFLSSCIVSPRHHRAVVVVGPPVEYGYQPLLYDGYVVYYSDDGIPFYWNGGVRIWVPGSYRDRYINHYRSHRSSYRSWHKNRGHHYRNRHYRKSRRHRDSPRVRHRKDNRREQERRRKKKKKKRKKKKRERKRRLRTAD